MHNTLTDRRLFWVGLVLVLAVAAWLRLESFDFRLPYIDHPDEPSLYVQALALRGELSPIPRLSGYPPAVLVQTDAVERVLRATGHPGAASTVYVNRLLAVGSNLATLLVVALLARHLANGPAGLLAGVAWGISPLVLENGVYGLADPHVYLLTALSGYFAVGALRKPERRHWLHWSTAAALLATLYKYPAVVALLPGGLVSLWLLRRDRQLWRIIAIQALMTAAVGMVALNVLGSDGMDMPVTRRAEGGMLQSLLTPSRLLANLGWLTSPLNTEAVAVLLALGALAYIVARRLKRPTVKGDATLLVGLTLLAIAWVVSAFSTPSESNRIRDIMPATPLACVLLGVAVGQMILLVPQRLKLAAVPVAAVLLYLFVYQAQWAESMDLLEEREKVDRRIALHRYVDTNLEPGTIIVSRSNDKTFNPFYSGLQGRHWYDWQETDNLMERPISDWLRRGLSYAAVTTGQYDELQETQEGRDFLAQMLYLKTVDDPPNGVGPRTMMYRLWPMEHEVDIAFAEGIHLVGYDVNTTTPRAGETLELRLYWQATETPLIDYSLFVHLLPAGGEAPVAQVDGAPARPERLTPTWDDPDETIISQLFSLPLPPDLEAGTYRLNFGLYDYVTGRRLTTLDDPPVDSVTLFDVDLAAP